MRRNKLARSVLHGVESAGESGFYLDDLTLEHHFCAPGEAPKVRQLLWELVREDGHAPAHAPALEYAHAVSKHVVSRVELMIAASPLPEHIPPEIDGLLRQGSVRVMLTERGRQLLRASVGRSRAQGTTPPKPR